ncbi:hypothetical protein [Rhizobium sp. BK602]|uniref:hypothetical protein n=1 Tax=Rhizobium sp. BK602 TaxID=2586986 RepID=UPI00160B56BF|nr:hypothetical protein [Rhizobium sp. BK602]MBB3610980.1 hypothetical protein [Rhizobium sp. BK602]
MKATGRKKKEKNGASFTTWKLNLENTVNADPKADGECLQIVRAYLDFMGSPDARPYRSLIDLKIATSLSENTIIQRRRKLVELGYFTEDGRTSDGATRYKIVNARENIVLDHQTIARETLRRLEAEKKEKTRQRRKKAGLSPSPHEGPLSPAQDEGLNGVCPLTPRRDSPSRHEGNYVYNSVEPYSYEEEEGINDTFFDDVETVSFIAETTQSSSTLTPSAATPLSEHDVYPIPGTHFDFEATMFEILGDRQVHDATERTLRKLLSTGALTRGMAERLINPPAPVIPTSESEFGAWVRTNIPDPTRHREAFRLLREHKMTPEALRRLAA